MDDGVLFIATVWGVLTVVVVDGEWLLPPFNTVCCCFWTGLVPGEIWVAAVAAAAAVERCCFR